MAFPTQSIYMNRPAPKKLKNNSPKDKEID